MAGNTPVDGYLDQVRAGLRGLPPGQIREIVAELRSHIHDSAGGGDADSVAEVLRRLGPPAEIAAMYGAPPGPSPAARWITTVAGSVLPMLAVAAGYALAASLVVTALSKPFAPDRAGLWKLAESPASFSLRLGLGGGHGPDGQDLLGWWIIPVGLLVGAGLGWLTTRFARRQLRQWRVARPTLP